MYNGHWRWILDGWKWTTVPALPAACATHGVPLLDVGPGRPFVCPRCCLGRWAAVLREVQHSLRRSGTGDLCPTHGPIHETRAGSLCIHCAIQELDAAVSAVEAHPAARGTISLRIPGRASCDVHGMPMAQTPLGPLCVWCAVHDAAIGPGTTYSTDDGTHAGRAVGLMNDLLAATAGRASEVTVWFVPRDGSAADVELPDEHEPSDMVHLGRGDAVLDPAPLVAAVVANLRGGQ